MASITLVIKTADIDSTTITASGSRRRSLSNLVNLLEGINSGSNNIGATVDVAYSTTSPVAAAGSIAVTQANVDADDTVTIGGVTLTAKASGANGTTQFNKGANLAATCTNLAACINANTTLNKVLTAASTGTAVTVTCNQKGVVGNLIVMSTSDATAFGLTQLTGGAGGVNGAFTSY